MTIYKYLQNTLITEARKSGVENYKPLPKVIDEYTKRPDSDDIYIHFSNNFVDSKEQLLNQIGINTKQDYNNAFGVYAYPITNIAAPFKIDADYAYILKNLQLPRWIQNIEDLSKNEFDRCMDVIENDVLGGDTQLLEDNIGSAKSSSTVGESFGAILWSVIYELSQDKKANSKSKPNVWQTMVWSKYLGYSFVGDNNGTSILQHGEPYQVIWFNSKGYEVLDVVKNKDYRYSYLKAKKFGNKEDAENAKKLGAPTEVSLEDMVYDLIQAVTKGDEERIKDIRQFIRPHTLKRGQLDILLPVLISGGRFDLLDWLTDDDDVMFNSDDVEDAKGTENKKMIDFVNAHLEQENDEDDFSDLYGDPYGDDDMY